LNEVLLIKKKYFLNEKEEELIMLWLGFNNNLILSVFLSCLYTLYRQIDRQKIFLNNKILGVEDSHPPLQLALFS
jgi:hypothetical protein